MDIHQTIAVLQIIVTALTAILASTGFWAYINRKKSNSSLTRKLLIGLAHDRLVTMSLRYIRRGYITQEEHENLTVFLSEPYFQIGGNGSVARLIVEVNKLPFKDVSQIYDLEKENENVK